MQMKRTRLTLVFGLLLASVSGGWRVAAADSSGTLLLDGSRSALSSVTAVGDPTPTPAGDPDTPLIIKGLTRAPDSDGGRGFTRAWQQYSWIGRAWVSVYLGRWFTR
jgi:hypothetical protein